MFVVTCGRALTHTADFASVVYLESDVIDRRSDANLLGLPASGGFEGDVGSIGCKTAAD